MLPFRHRFWPRAVAFLGLMAGAAALTACHKPDGRIHVIYWDKWTGHEEVAIRQEVDAFNRSQSRIEVDYLAVNNVNQKTIVAIAGGDPPDLAGLWDQDVYPFCDHQALLCLDDFIRQDGETPDHFLDAYIPVYAEMGRYHGKIYALPTTVNASMLYWNKELFRQAGLDPEQPPRTVEELDAMSDKLTRRDASGALTQIGFLPQEPGWFLWGFPAWFGGGLWDGHNVIIGKSPRNLECYKWVRGYTERYGLNTVQSFTSGFGTLASSQNAFLSRKVAMVIHGVYLDNYIEAYAPGLDYGVAMWPKTPGGFDDFTTVDCDNYVIPRGSRHPHEAWEFMKFMSTINLKAQSFDEMSGLEALSFLQKKISPFKEWSPYFEHHHPHPYVAAFRKAAESPHSFHLPSTSLWPQYGSELNALFDRVRLEQMTPEEAIAACQARMDSNNRYNQETLARRHELETP